MRVAVTAASVTDPEEQRRVAPAQEVDPDEVQVGRHGALAVDVHREALLVDEAGDVDPLGVARPEAGGHDDRAELAHRHRLDRRVGERGRLRHVGRRRGPSRHTAEDELHGRAVARRRRRRGLVEVGREPHASSSALDEVPAEPDAELGERAIVRS